MYDSAIEYLIASCEWDPARFLIFSENVFDPFIYYSHVVPLILSVSIGIFILYQSPRQLVTRILFAITALFSLWVFLDLILWAHHVPQYIMFFWSVINLIEPFIYASSLYFVQVFITNKDTSLRTKIFSVLPLLPFMALISTDFTLLGYDLSNCDREAIEGPLTHYAYLVEIFYVLWILDFATRRYVKTKDSVTRHKIILVTSGILLFLLSFSFGNIIGSLTEDWRIPQWGLFGMPIFIAFLSYLIVQYEAFRIKLIATEVLVVMMSTLIGSQFFFIRNPTNRILNAITFLLSIVGGILVLKSVRKEIRQRELIELQEKELVAANEQLKTIDRQKSEFLSIAAHQLRTPLTAVKWSAGAMLEKTYGEVPEYLRSPLQTIFDESSLMAIFINDYLNLSRIEQGRMEYRFEATDIASILETVARELEPAMIKKSLALKTDIPKEKVQIWGDSAKLQQIFSNLIDNSLKYTQSGSISANLHVDTQKGVATVKISDTGVGMSKETKEKIFDKFVRGDNASEVNKGGAGLGLFVARTFVQAHKGSISADSAGVGKGTTFTIDFPLYTGTEKANA